MKTLILKDSGCEGVQDLIIFNQEIDPLTFQSKVRAFWEAQILKEDYEFDEMYDFIRETWDVQDIVHLDNIEIFTY